jgi:hypothetical protein
MYKSPSSDQIPGDLYQAGGELLMSVIHKPITSIWNKEELPDHWKDSIIVPIHKNADKNGCNNYHINFIQNFINYHSFTVKSIHRCNYWAPSV